MLATCIPATRDDRTRCFLESFPPPVIQSIITSTNKVPKMLEHPIDEVQPFRFLWAVTVVTPSEPSAASRCSLWDTEPIGSFPARIPSEDCKDATNVLGAMRISVCPPSTGCRQALQPHCDWGLAFASLNTAVTALHKLAWSQVYWNCENSPYKRSYTHSHAVSIGLFPLVSRTLPWPRVTGIDLISSLRYGRTRDRRRSPHPQAVPPLAHQL